MKILQRKDGYYYCSKMMNGKRVQIVSKSKKELKQKLVNLEYNLQNNFIEKNISVEKWSYEWLETYKKNVASYTYKMYEQAIRVHIVPSLGKIQLKNLKETDIMNMLNEMADKGITRKRDVALLTIKQILQKAVLNDLIYKNVALNIKIKKHTAPEKKPIPDEYIQIIKANLDKPYCKLCYFLIYTGLRREELIPLTYEDINFKDKTITINKAVSLEHNQPVLKKTKNETTRIIPLLDTLELNLSHFSKGLIFFNQYGNMLSETSFKRQIDYTNNLIKKNVVNYERFTAHQLRHTYACILHKAGVPLKEAQYFMGHKDIKMLLNIYTHSDNEDKIKAKNKLNEFVKL
jgi:integrase